MILILEDDADREQYQRVHPLNPEFLNPDTMRPATVWISPEAYRAEAVLADLRAKVEALKGGGGGPDPLDWGWTGALDKVLALFDGGGDEAA